jgi:hypothetical protein
MNKSVKLLMLGLVRKFEARISKPNSNIEIQNLDIGQPRLFEIGSFDIIFEIRHSDFEFLL